MELNLDAELDAILNNSESDNNASFLFVDSLDRYLNKVESLMNNWLNEFEWDRETLFKSQSTHGLVCPFNEAHRKISQKNYSRHVQRCRLKSLNFSKLNIVIIYIFYFILCLFIYSFRGTSAKEDVFILFYVYYIYFKKKNSSNQLD